MITDRKNNYLLSKALTVLCSMLFRCDGDGANCRSHN